MPHGMWSFIRFEMISISFVNSVCGTCTVPNKWMPAPFQYIQLRCEAVSLNSIVGVLVLCERECFHEHNAISYYSLCDWPADRKMAENEAISLNGCEPFMAICVTLNRNKHRMKNYRRCVHARIDTASSWFARRFHIHATSDDFLTHNAFVLRILSTFHRAVAKWIGIHLHSNLMVC